jgi:hypothetical protein
MKALGRNFFRSGVGGAVLGGVASWLNEKTIQKAVRDKGWAPVIRRDAILTRLGGEGRIDQDKWRETLRAEVTGMQPGDKFDITWQIFKRDPAGDDMYSEGRNVTYQKQADGTWRAQVPEGGETFGDHVQWKDNLRVPDLNVLLHGSPGDAAQELGMIPPT